MLKIFKRGPYSFIKFCIGYLLLICQPACAFNQNPTLGQAAGNILEPIGIITSGVNSLCYIIGGTLIMGAAMQYKNYRNNPSAVRLSTPVVLLLLGIGLILLPILSNLSPASQAANS